MIAKGQEECASIFLDYNTFYLNKLYENRKQCSSDICNLQFTSYNLIYCRNTAYPPTPFPSICDQQESWYLAVYIFKT